MCCQLKKRNKTSKRSIFFLNANRKIFIDVKNCGVYRIYMFFNGEFFGKCLRKNDIKTVGKSAAAHVYGLITRTARKPEMIENLQ